MLEIILFGSFFFANEPEQMLFMLYTLMLIWGAIMRTVSHPPIYAPHVLDVVAAAKAATTCGAVEAGDSTCSPAITSNQVISLVPKFCGRTIGEIAATCGISLAISAYFDSRRFHAFPRQWIDEKTKKKFRKQLRNTLSYVLGVTVNFIADVEDWWAAQSFFKKDPSTVASDL